MCKILAFYVTIKMKLLFETDQNGTLHSKTFYFFYSVRTLKLNRRNPRLLRDHSSETLVFSISINRLRADI